MKLLHQQKENTLKVRANSSVSIVSLLSAHIKEVMFSYL